MHRWIRWSTLSRNLPLSLFVLLLCAMAGIFAWPRFSQAQRGQGVQPVPAVAGGRYVALLIAVQNYADKNVRTLDHPISDAEQVRQVLTTEYQFEPRDVTLVKDPDRKTLLGALNGTAGRLRPEDRLLIFFAGHGFWDENRKQGYWLPSDAEKGEHSTWISNSDIRDSIRAIKARHVLLISDACFSGSLLVTREAFARSTAVEQVDKLPSRTAMTSGALTTVPDRSVFLSYLLKKLRENQEPYLLALDLFAQLRTPVINNSPRQSDGTLPTPRYDVIQEAGDGGGDFIFARRAAPPLVRMSVAGVPLTTLAPFTTVTVDGNGKITERRSSQESWGYVEDLGLDERGNRVRLEMVEVPGGDFLMGEDAAGAADFERECSRWVNQNFTKEDCARWAKQAMPQHRVNVKGFLLGKYEVTQGQWKAVMEALPPNMSDLKYEFKGDDFPVVNVSWEEAQEFIRKLNENLKLTRSMYRLPSEAEWEYAARAGTRTPFAFGETIRPEMASYGWTAPHRNAPKANFPEHPVKVGSFIANGYGLFDLHGNVWEWCEDDWHESYQGAPLDGRAWIDSSSRGWPRVIRGGGWNSNAVDCRSAYRIRNSPGYRNHDLGFRLLRTYR